MLAAKAAVDCLVDGSSNKSEIWAVNTEEEYHETKEEARDDSSQGLPPAARAA